MPATRPDVTTMDIIYLKHSTYFRILDDQNFYLVTNGIRSIRLSRHPLQPLVLEAANYLINFQQLPCPRNPLPKEPQPQHETFSTYSPAPPAGYDAIIQSLGRLHTDIQQN